MHTSITGDPLERHACVPNDLDLELDRFGHMTNDSLEMLWARFRTFGAIMKAVADAGYDWYAVEPLSINQMYELDRIARAKLVAQERPAFQRVVGMSIFEERKKQRFRGEDVARAIGVSRPVLSKIESGRRPIRLTELLKIAEVLQRPPSWFLAAAEETCDVCGNPAAKVETAMRE